MKDKLPFLSPEYANDPKPYWKKLRETDPVYYAEEYGFWAITKHGDILEILKDPITFSSAGGPAGGMIEGNDDAHSENGGVGFLPLLQNDPPEHSRIRSIFAKAFTPKRISEMEPALEKIANELMANIERKIKNNEPIDLVDDFASPLPVLAIANMMGIPHEERHNLRMWSDSLAIGAGESFTLKQKSLNQREMTKGLKQIIEDARNNPQKDTLISAMLQAAEDGQSLQENEILGLCKLLWLAGNETTTNLIGNGIVFLLNNLDILKELQEDKSLIPDFIEELFRYDGPVMGLFRHATRDVDFKGHKIKKGQSIWLLFSSGNLDEEHYPDAEKFNLHRKNKDHLALGKRIHFCMGSALARLEAKIAFEHLVGFIHTVSLDFEKGKRIPVPVLSGWLKLPVTVGSCI